MARDWTPPPAWAGAEWLPEAGTFRVSGQLDREARTARGTEVSRGQGLREGAVLGWVCCVRFENWPPDCGPQGAAKDRHPLYKGGEDTLGRGSRRVSGDTLHVWGPPLACLASARVRERRGPVWVLGWRCWGGGGRRTRPCPRGPAPRPRPRGPSSLPGGPSQPCFQGCRDPGHVGGHVTELALLPVRPFSCPEQRPRCAERPSS